MIGDPSSPPIENIRRGPTRTQKFANARFLNPTKAEKELEQILNINKGEFRGKFQREWVCGKWILDFFFDRNRFGIEVDGGYHLSPTQKKKDIEKEAHCRRVEITLLRLTNHDVFGNRKALLEKLCIGYNRADRHMLAYRLASEAKRRNLILETNHNGNSTRRTILSNDSPNQPVRKRKLTTYLS